MLVLARGKNETIVINDDIEITIVDIRADQVKLGIQAPKNVKVNRKEVYEKIKQEMKEAAESQLPNFNSSVETKIEPKIVPDKKNQDYPSTDETDRSSTDDTKS